MTRFTDYLYATVPSFCIAAPIAQFLPDLSFFQGLEKLGIVGIMGLGIIFFVAERRSFIAKSSEKLDTLEKRMTNLETKVATGNDKMISIMGQQLSELKEIKVGQTENFDRMWQLTLRCLNGGQAYYEDTVSGGLEDDETDVLRQEEDSA